MVAGRLGEVEQKSKIKGQKDRAKFKDVVRGFSLVHDPEGSHYIRKEQLLYNKAPIHNNERIH